MPANGHTHPAQPRLRQLGAGLRAPLAERVLLLGIIPADPRVALPRPAHVKTSASVRVELLGNRDVGRRSTEAVNTKKDWAPTEQLPLKTTLQMI